MTETVRVTYHRLTPAARETIRWSGVVSVAGFVRNWNPDGRWSGDRCGCFDDRCIGYHHEEGGDCGCLSAVLADWAYWGSR